MVCDVMVMAMLCRNRKEKRHEGIGLAGFMPAVIQNGGLTVTVKVVTVHIPM